MADLFSNVIRKDDHAASERTATPPRLTVRHNDYNSDSHHDNNDANVPHYDNGDGEHKPAIDVTGSRCDTAAAKQA